MSLSTAITTSRKRRREEDEEAGGNWEKNDGDEYTWVEDDEDEENKESKNEKMAIAELRKAIEDHGDSVPHFGVDVNLIFDDKKTKKKAIRHAEKLIAQRSPNNGGTLRICLFTDASREGDFGAETDEPQPGGIGIVFQDPLQLSAKSKDIESSARVLEMYSSTHGEALAVLEGLAHVFAALRRHQIRRPVEVEVFTDSCSLCQALDGDANRTTFHVVVLEPIIHAIVRVCEYLRHPDRNVKVAFNRLQRCIVPKHRQANILSRKHRITGNRPDNIYLAGSMARRVAAVARHIRAETALLSENLTRKQKLDRAAGCVVRRASEAGESIWLQAKRAGGRNTAYDLTTEITGFDAISLTGQRPAKRVCRCKINRAQHRKRQQKVKDDLPRPVSGPLPGETAAVAIEIDDDDEPGGEAPMEKGQRRPTGGQGPITTHSRQGAPSRYKVSAAATATGRPL